MRIRFPACFTDKVKYLHTGLSDEPINRYKVETTLKEIELDIRLNKFDKTLTKYKFKNNILLNDKIDIITLWDKYTKYRSNFVCESTIKRDYKKIASRISKINNELNNDDIEEVLLRYYSPETTRRTIVYLNSCFEWAINKKIINENKLANKKRIPQTINKKLKRHFSDKEVLEIIKAFSEKKHSKYYVNFIRFLFYTGCRLEEAVALKWENIGKEYITINTSCPCDTKIEDKTKTKSARNIPITKQIKEILEEQLKLKTKSNLVFSSKTGVIINYNNLGTRHWNPIIKTLFEEKKIGIRLSLNHTRHTFINQCLAKGISINQVAYWVGNSPKTIINNYASVVEELMIPDLY